MSKLSNNRGTRGRTASVNRNTNAPAGKSPALSVFTSQRLIQPARQRDGVPEFLGRLAEFNEKRRRDKADDTAAEVDASGRELTEEEQGNQLLVNTVAFKRGKRLAVERLAEIEATADRDIMQAIENGDMEGLDPDTYVQRKFADLVNQAQNEGDNSDNPFFNEQIQTAMSTAKTYMSKRTSQIEAEAADTQMIEDFTGTIAAAAGSKDPMTAEKLLGFAQEENEDDLAFGLTRNEISEGTANGLLNAISRAPTKERAEELHEALTGFLKSHDQSYLDRTSGDIQDIVDESLTRIKTEEADASALTASEEGRWLGNVGARIQLNPGDPKLREDLLDGLDRGILTPTKFASLDGQRIRGISDRLEDSQDRGKKAAMFKAFDEFPATLEMASSADRKAYFNYKAAEYEPEIKQFMGELAAAVDLTDPQAQSDQLAAMNSPNGSLTALQPLLDLGDTHGYTPRPVLAALNVRDVDSPRLATAARARALIKERVGADSQMFADVDSGSSALLDVYTQFTRDAGMTDEQAKARIKERAVTDIQELRKDFLRKEHRGDNRVPKALDEAVESFGDIRNVTNLRVKLRDLALEQYRISGDAESAIEWARGRIKETSANMGGTLVPARGIHAIMRDNYNTAPMQELMQTALRAKGYEGDLDNIQIMPMPNTGTTGKVRVLDKESSTFLMEDGKALALPTLKLSKLFLTKIEYHRDLNIEDLDLNQVRQDEIDKQLRLMRRTPSDIARAYSSPRGR